MKPAFDVRVGLPDGAVGRRAALPLAGVMAMMTPANMSAKPSTPTMRSCRATPAMSPPRCPRRRAARRVRWIGSSAGHAPPDGRHEIGVVAIEIALHLVEKTLLLLRKRHLIPLRLGIDASSDHSSAAAPR